MVNISFKKLFNLFFEEIQFKVVESSIKALIAPLENNEVVGILILDTFNLEVLN
ncbi:hypothetical protein BHO_0054500 [Borrelia hermsii YBT]|uniref:hypothetical protein n=1 Tax=Borrelia hermsii TaxID=140 RepID=UPI0003E3A399|nr:hypothetical protein [Borrelia hermsii]AHH12632.1 hypothetical protein BHO_0054500 [Borrelia hermsii YBT]